MPGETLVRLADSAGAEAVPSVGSVTLERRSEPRKPTNWIAKIRLPGGDEIGCTVKDVSKSGARIGLPDNIVLPEHFQLTVLGYDFLIDVRPVWRKDNCAGLRIERFGKQPPPTVEPETPKPAADPAETYTVQVQRRGRVSSY